MASLAIIVATRDREAMLQRMLTSALAFVATDQAGLDVIIADNGSRDGTRSIVEAATQRDARVRYLWAPHGGKSQALNTAIRMTDAPILAFVDDDIIFDRAWLDAVTAYFANTNAGAAQGAILLPPEVAADAALTAEVERWGTIPRRELTPTARTSRSLTGANMFVTRQTFARVGLFDERLGPGAAGACEDTELALRVQAAGIDIGTIPNAIVYHAVERERLTTEHLRAMHELRGRSRTYYKPSGASRILPNLAMAALAVAWTTIGGSPRARVRALGRWYHYRAMLRMRRAPRLPGGAPQLEES